MMSNVLEDLEHYMTGTLRPRALLPVLLLCLGTISACSREADQWRAAQSSDTVAAYEQFTRDHPASAHAAEAATRLAQLAEDEDWRRAQEEDSLQAYQNFANQHPESRWTQEARVRIETITLGSTAAQDPATGAGLGGDGVDGGALREPPAQPPALAAGPHPANPPPVKAAPKESAPKMAAAPKVATAPQASTAAKSGVATAPVVYGVQLGAFSSEAAAQARWQVLSAQAALKGHSPHVVAGQSANGRVYRLQVAAKDEAAARQLCGSLTASGQACVVVHP